MHIEEERDSTTGPGCIKNPIGKGHCKIAHTNNNKYKNRRGRRETEKISGSFFRK